MAAWPTNPDWVDPSTGINSGNQYVASDGVTVSDFNNLIKDMIYLKNIPMQTIVTRITKNGTYTITPSTGYKGIGKITIVVERDYSQLVTSDGEDFITSDGKNFKVLS